MGITITIGEAELRVTPEDDESPITAHVAKRTHPEAPRNGSDAPCTNHRSFSYTGFGAWAKASGLESLFYDESRGLTRQDLHPGCVLLRPEHLAAVRAAQQRPHPEPRSQWAPQHKDLLVWFAWWMEWALANCKVPAIYNW